MNIIKLLLIAAFTVVLFSISQATNNPISVGDRVEGYIIKDNGKKIVGKIIIGTIIENEESVTFIAKGKSKKSLYSPKEVKAYAYQTGDIDDTGRKVKKWIHYERQKADVPPRPFGSIQVFMQKEVAGEIELYSYYVEKAKDATQSLQYYYYIKTKDGGFSKVAKNEFEHSAKNIFRDYTALYGMVESGKFSYRNLDQMIRDYNFWLVNKHDRNEYRVAMKIEKKSEKEDDESEKDVEEEEIQY